MAARAQPRGLVGLIGARALFWALALAAVLAASLAAGHPYHRE